MVLLGSTRDKDEAHDTTSQLLLPQTPAHPSLWPWSWMGWSAPRALPTVSWRPSSRQLSLPSTTSGVSWRAQPQGQVTQGAAGAGVHMNLEVSFCRDYLGTRTQPAGSWGWRCEQIPALTSFDAHPPWTQGLLGAAEGLLASRG